MNEGMMHVKHCMCTSFSISMQSDSMEQCMIADPKGKGIKILCATLHLRTALKLLYAYFYIILRNQTLVVNSISDFFFRTNPIYFVIVLT